MCSQVPALRQLTPLLAVLCSLSLPAVLAAQVTEKLGESADRAAEEALQWLLRNQRRDGSWRAVDSDFDVGVTALVSLAFTSSGYTHLDGWDPDCCLALFKASRYLRKAQQESKDPRLDGCFGEQKNDRWIYNHAVATYAMSYLFVLSDDKSLEDSVKRAVELCFRARNEEGAWGHGVTPGHDDTSVTGWVSLALGISKYADLQIPREKYEKAWTGVRTWLAGVTDTSGRVGYRKKGVDNRARGWPEPYPFSEEIPTMTAVGLTALIYSNESRKYPGVRKAAELVLKHPPRWDKAGKGARSTVDFVYWLFATQGMFQYGQAYEKWRERMIPVLVRAQRREGGNDSGSWDPAGEWCRPGGRVYSTAMALMVLGVDRRWRLIQDLEP